jgi:hypothetical protein
MGMSEQNISFSYLEWKYIRHADIYLIYEMNVHIYLLFLWKFCIIIFMLSWIFIVLAHWNNSLREDMSLHSDTLFWFRANQSLLFLLNAVCLAEKQQILIL